MMLSLFSILVSFVIVAFGQPAWFTWLSPLAAALGYAIFWNSLRHFTKSVGLRVGVSGLWYAGVQMVQLSWMTATEYHGVYILVVHAAISIGLGILFAALSYFLFAKKSLSWLRIGALAGMWTILEWVRFHIMCGFSWNPAGIALAAYPISMQLAAVTGVLGLSFWVLLTNLVGLKELWRAKHQQRGFLRWLGVALFPYVFGTCFWIFQSGGAQEQTPTRVALVQTGLLPSQKIPLAGRSEEFLSPWIQWERIFAFLKDCKANQPSLIVLPEYTIPFSSNHTIYEADQAVALLKSAFGLYASEALPPFEAPFATTRADSEGNKVHFVSNSFFSQFLANYFQADVVIGMDDRDPVTKKCYSAGLFFSPHGQTPQRYEKQVLVPLAEYLPFEWCRSLVAGYGITDFYTRGEGAKVFAGKKPLSLSICYEETFPEIIREGKCKGAELLVNLTNDNWYPDSKLAKQHFDHGRLRAVENGVPLVRACNSGVTAVINARGEIVDQLKENEGVLYADVPSDTIATPYARWGDALVIGISLGLLLSYGIFSRILSPGRTKKFLSPGVSG